MYYLFHLQYLKEQLLCRPRFPRTGVTRGGSRGWRSQERVGGAPYDRRSRPGDRVNTPDPMTLLSAMITPAVLISACGTLILSTSTRLARIMDRVRELGTISKA